MLQVEVQHNAASKVSVQPAFEHEMLLSRRGSNTSSSCGMLPTNVASEVLTDT